jgi:Uma2 family endonuclease
MMSTAGTLMTVDDLLHLPPDHLRHELVRGELTTMPPTSDEHGVRTVRVTIRLGVFIEKHNLGEAFGAETGFIISRNPDTVRAPDFAFVTKDRMTKQGLTGRFYPAAPDLAVEVLSPSDSAADVQEKIDEWLEAGTRQVWVINPAKKTVHVHSPGRAVAKSRVGDTLDGEDVLPGLKLPVADLFA